MKKIILLIILAAAVFEAYAQETVDGMWGIPFGSTQAATKKLIDLKYEIKPKTDMSRMLKYTNCPFGDYKAESISLMYFNDKFYQGGVYINPTSEERILDEYHALVSYLEKIHGKADTSMEEYDPPYEKGGGSELMAIRQGHAEIYTFWSFPKNSDSDKIDIVLGLQKDMQLVIIYTENDTFKKAH